jgi:hypothetical protein
MRLQDHVFPGLVLLSIHPQNEISELAIKQIMGIKITADDIIPISQVTHTIFELIRENLDLKSMEYKTFGFHKSAPIDDLWRPITILLEQIEPTILEEFLQLVAPDGDKMVVAALLKSITKAFTYQIRFFSYAVLAGKCNYIKSEIFSAANRLYIF